MSGERHSEGRQTTEDFPNERFRGLRQKVAGGLVFLVTFVVGQIAAVGMWNIQTLPELILAGLMVGMAITLAGIGLLLAVVGVFEVGRHVA